MGGKKRDYLIQFTKFNIIGIINTIFTYLLYSMLVFVGMGHKLALTVDYAAGIIVSFILNKKITFQNRKPATLKMFSKMIFSYLCVFGINMGLLILLVDYMHLNPYLGQLIAQGAVVVFSFFLQKYFVFNENTNKTSSSVSSSNISPRREVSHL